MSNISGYNKHCLYLKRKDRVSSLVTLCVSLKGDQGFRYNEYSLWSNSDLSYLFITVSLSKTEVVISGIKPNNDWWVAFTLSFSNAPLSSPIIYSLATEYLIFRKNLATRRRLMLTVDVRDWKQMSQRHSLHAPQAIFVPRAHAPFGQHEESQCWPKLARPLGTRIKTTVLRLPEVNWRHRALPASTWIFRFPCFCGCFSILMFQTQFQWVDHSL